MSKVTITDKQEIAIKKGMKHYEGFARKLKEVTDVSVYARHLFVTQHWMIKEQGDEPWWGLYEPLNDLEPQELNNALAFGYNVKLIAEEPVIWVDDKYVSYYEIDRHSLSVISVDLSADPDNKNVFYDTDVATKLGEDIKKLFPDSLVQVVDNVNNRSVKVIGEVIG